MIKTLQALLRNAVESNKVPGILFSGGLDTSILAGILCSVSEPSGVHAVSVSFLSDGEDRHYAKELAEILRMHHVHVAVGVDEAIDAIPGVIKTLESFDPGIPNDLAAYFGLKTLSDMDVPSAMTGDGSDEIFGGYDYMRDIDNLSAYIQNMTHHMSFSSNVLANDLGMDIRQPFLDEELLSFALNIPDSLRIKEENGKVYGKWILRKAFEGLIPERFIWQDKRPLEVGSGMSGLRDIITSRISDKEFSEKSREYTVKFRNKEHLYYYEIFRKEIGEIPLPRNGEKICRGCGTGIENKKSHCKVCGWMEGEL
ncbi:MAG: Asparagine synthetase B (glutamine-hydrolyzing) [Syntrophorhabdus sp. PtaU1.Bin058]|nr:MAG: Asparagine synthetase B (glutamine-hydrolyzing) [Syntrophorhabdus sp. PtaU1.Bin058]